MSRLDVRGRSWIWVGMYLCAAVLLVGCGEAGADGERADKLRIVATTTMIEDLARRIAGDDATVVGIMKPGEDPHIYDVRPQDAELIRKAHVVLMNGFHLEATLADIAQQHAGDARVVHLAEASGIEPLKSDGALSGAPDPHLWMNAAHFRRYAEVARDAIIAADPDHADAYRRRADAYIAELEALDDWIREQVATVPRERRVIVTSHDAFQYFGAAYDVDVHGVIGISTEQQPRPQDLQRLEALVRERGVRALFIETSVSQVLNNLVKKLAENTGANVGGTLYSDSLGDEGTPAGDYIGMMKHNTTTIVEALK